MKKFIFLICLIFITGCKQHTILTYNLESALLCQDNSGQNYHGSICEENDKILGSIIYIK